MIMAIVLVMPSGHDNGKGNDNLVILMSLEMQW